jgi:hypothetical protein
MNETDVRRELRRLWGKVGITWTEQAMGGTYGAPDVTLDLPDGVGVPVELKFWERTAAGVLVCKVRPAQYRWHMMARANGKRTAFIIGQNCKDCLVLGAFSGHLVPKEPRPPGGPPIMWPVTSRQGLIKLFCNDSFWGATR